MPEQFPLKDPRFKGKRYEIQLEEGNPRLVQESAEVCAERIALTEQLFTRFEEEYPVDMLNAIAGFSSREERLASPRAAAQTALGPIVTELRFLSSQEAVPEEVCARFQARYKVLSKALGSVRNDPTGVLFEVVVRD